MTADDKKILNKTFATKKELEDFVDSVLYARVPGHEGGNSLKIGQLNNRMTVRDLELNILNNVRERFKTDIQGLHPEDIRGVYIPGIINELVAIRSTTETSTTTILECAENLSMLGEALPDDMKNEIEKHTTRILETSSFQDITGQRMGKVIQTLEQIELTIDGILSALGDEVARKRYQEKLAKIDTVKDPGELLEGPDLLQSPDKQKMIDEMFS